VNFLRRLFVKSESASENAAPSRSPDSGPLALAPAEEEQRADAAPGLRLVIGLGNPGSEYDGTRHNIGFEVADLLARERGLRWERVGKLRAKLAVGADAIFAKPITYMNLSGEAAARIVRREGIAPRELLAVYDDVSLPLGRLRFRESGSAGGHNGMRSLIERLGTDGFPRLRIGIGAAGQGEMIDHVLGRFSPEESESVEKVLAIAAEGVNCALSAGLSTAMNRYNQRSG
jgi:PTH1 family peptidyl-tRNA hydrolase